MFLVYLFFVFGFALLVKGADWLIDGASAIARRLKISDIVIGLTVVAFGTSAPELVVSVISSIKDSGELVAGNVIGSNITNISIGLGVAGLVAPFIIKKSLIKKEILLGILGAALIYFLAIRSGEILTISRLSGGLLVLGFAMFLGWLYYDMKSGKHPPELEEAPKHKHGIPAAITLTTAGLAGLAFGGELVVNNALKIAEHFGASESLIGLSLVAIGTSLPELVTSIVAMKKGKSSMAVGGIVGSNIFNIFWVLGLSALIRPITFHERLIFDVQILIGITLLLITTIFVSKRYEVSRWQAVMLSLIYFAYLFFIFWRG